MSNPYNVVVLGPLGLYAEGFHAELRALGYRPNASSPQLALMAHLSRWLEHHGLEPGDLDTGVVDEFLASRSARSRSRSGFMSSPCVQSIVPDNFGCSG